MSKSDSISPFSYKLTNKGIDVAKELKNEFSKL